MPIRILDPQVAARIAAGEVIERPASVVKELLDNAIDAGATRISVEVRGGGLDLIRVMDNGCGIPAEEVPLAFARHATSKITTVDDLLHVQTLGFRGEALPSIAAAAQVTMVTCPPDAHAGTLIRLVHGQMVEQRPQGAPAGTTVTVEHLFAELPARRKFLKAPATEASHISHVVSQYALAYPGITFILIVDGRLLLHSPGNGDLFDAIIKVFGLDTARAMIAVGANASSGAAVQSPAVWGYVSQPAITRSHRGYLSFFVNRRWVHNRLLVFAVEEAYHTLLPSGRHPIAVLHVRISPDEVDVNVHPAKSEVRFVREREVFSVVQRAVRAALVASAGIPTIQTAAAPGPVVAPARWTSPPPAPSHAIIQASHGHGEEGPSPWPSQPPPQPSATKLPPLRILGQLAQTYIIAEAPEGMVLIDQHTAHERVIYERLMAERAHRTATGDVIPSITPQLLLDPILLELTPRQQAALDAHREHLERLGFRLEPFGERAVLIRSLPPIVRPAQAAQTIGAVLDEIGEGGNALADVEERLIVSVTCHSAVRAGQTLTLDEMRELVEQLEKTSLPRTCPHGRPTLIFMSQAQLEKEFGRR